MGRSLVAWVGDGTERVGSGYDSCLKNDVFTMWIRIALSREFVSSCKFDETNAGNFDEDASSESSNMTHSTIKSRMKNIRMGTIIMPFRADTAECLFISSIIHASSLKFNFLRTLLHSALRPIALNPELYTFPRNLPMEVQLTANGPPMAGHHHSSMMHLHLPNPFSSANKEKESPPPPTGNLRESLSRQSSRFMGLFRNVFARGNSGRPNSVSMEDRPMSVDPSNRPTSAMLSTYLYLIGAKSSQSQESAAAALNELAMLTPLDLKRLEVRKRLQDCAAALVQRFEEVHDAFPSAVVIILNTIRDLIIVTQPNNGSSKNKEDKEYSESDIGENDSELYRNRRRFEFGTYFTSCSALLFLRLICRAIISPDDYGVTKYITVHHAAPSSSGTANARASKRTSRSYADAVANSPGSVSSYEATVGGTPEKSSKLAYVFPKAVAPMLLLAHTVAYEPPEDSSNKKPQRRELLESRYAAEILSLSENLSTQMPAEMVSHR